MLGRQHLVITSLTVSGLILPFYYFMPVISTAMLIGAILGSLIPDIDGSDALIFHGKVFRVKAGYTQVFNLFPGILLPLFGYATKYVIYLPSVLAFKIFLPRHYRPEYGHRKYMHSFLGVGTTSAVTGLTALTFLALTGFLNLAGLILITGFLIGYTAGALMHLLEDACTKTGVMFFYPFSHVKTHGKLITGKDMVKPHLLTISSAATFFTGLYLFFRVGPVNTFETVLGLNLIFWTVFLGTVAQIEITN